MRIVSIFLIILAFGVLLLASYGLLNTYVSIKYEIQEDFNPKNIDSSVTEKAAIYKSLVQSLWVNIFFSIIVLILVIKHFPRKSARKS